MPHKKEEVARTQREARQAKDHSRRAQGGKRRTPRAGIRREQQRERSRRETKKTPREEPTTEPERCQKECTPHQQQERARENKHTILRKVSLLSSPEL